MSKHKQYSNLFSIFLVAITTCLVLALVPTVQATLIVKSGMHPCVDNPSVICIGPYLVNQIQSIGPHPCPNDAGVVCNGPFLINQTVIPKANLT